MKIITSTDNLLIKKFRSLSVKKYREQFGLCFLEGEKVIKEALNIKGLVANLIIPESAKDKYIHLVDCYNNITIVVSDEVYKSLAFALIPQSIMAVINIPKGAQLDLSKNIIVLDGLQDPGNLGTIIRSGVASGHTQFILINSVDPYNDKTIRSASGTIFYSTFFPFKREDFVQFVIDNKLNLFIADMDGENLYQITKVPRPYALVVGSEGQGVSSKILNLPHKTFAIPMDKRVESLNAGVSASVIMFSLANLK